MFGWKKKQRQLELQVKELEQRLEHNSKIIEEDHHDLAELKVMSAAATALIDALQAKIELLFDRQKRLREGLKVVIDTETRMGIPKQTLEEGVPFLGDLYSGKRAVPQLSSPGIPLADHVCCVDSDGNHTGTSDICIYCHPDLRKEND